VVVELGDHLVGVPVAGGHLDLVPSIWHVVGDRDIERDLNGTRVGSNVADHRRAVAHLDGHVAVVDLQRESAGGRHAVVEVVAHVHLTRVEDVDHHLRLGAARDGSLREEEIENGRAADLSIGRLACHDDPDRIAADRVASDQRRLPRSIASPDRGRGGPGERDAGDERPGRDERENQRGDPSRPGSSPSSDTGSTRRGVAEPPERPPTASNRVIRSCRMLPT